MEERSSRRNYYLPTVRLEVVDHWSNMDLPMNKIWAIDENPSPLQPTDYMAKSAIDLLLKPSEKDLKFWPHW